MKFDFSIGLMLYLSFGVFSAASVLMLFEFFRFARSVALARGFAGAISVLFVALFVLDLGGLAILAMLFFSSTSGSPLFFGTTCLALSFVATFAGGRWLLNQEFRDQREKE